MNRDQLDKIITEGGALIADLESNDQVKDEVTSLVEDFKAFAVSAKELLAEGKVLKIGVVGQVKAGKSSFLNSLLFDGEDVLPKASTPMTAGLTIMEYTDGQSYFETEYYSHEDWEEFEKSNATYEKTANDIREGLKKDNTPDNIIEQEIKKNTTERQQSAHELLSMCKSAARNKIGSKSEKSNFDGAKGLQSTLERFVGAKGDYTPVVKSLHIYLNDERLKGVRIVDTPGVNDPIISRENRTREFLGSCHGVFFLSYSGRFLDSQDIRFMNTRVASTGIGSIVLLASKYDSVLQDAGMKFRGTPQEGNLDYADEYAQRNLKNFYSTKRNEIEVNPDKIEFATTSGIGFSIAKKKAEDYDDVEKHVIKQMKTFYPDAFTDEEYRDTFMSLANIDHIRDEYFAKEFVAKKEEIIGEKINNFFSKSGCGLSETVSAVRKTTENRLEKILSSNIEKIEQEKAEMQNVFSNISAKLPNLIDKFLNGIQQQITRFNNKIERPKASQLVKLIDTQFDVSCERDLAFFGDKNITQYSKFVDYNQSRDAIQAAISAYADKWQKLWGENFKQCKKKLYDEYCKIIADFSQKTTNQSIENEVREIMDKVLSDIDGNDTLDFIGQNTIVKLVEALEDCVSVTKPGEHYYPCKDKEVQKRLNEEVEESIRNVEKNVEQQLRNLKLFADEAERCAQNTLNFLKPVKDNIKQRLTEESNTYFARFEEQIRNVQSVKPKYESAIQQLEQLEKLLK